VVLLRLAGFLLRQRRLLLWSAAAWGLVALLASIIPPRTYIATAAFTPSAPDVASGLGQLAGLATQLGFPLDVGATDQTGFYVALVTSRETLERIIADTYEVRTASGRIQEGDLRELLHVRGQTDHERTWRAVKLLRKRIHARGNRQTNIVEVKVEARYPSLAEGIGERLLRTVNDFDLERRQLRASLERRFVESRIVAAESSLAVAESTLARFLYRNRTYRDSPSLILEQDKLSRRVDLRQQVLTALVQSLERARIEEVRNTSVIIPIDHPSAVPEPRAIPLKLLLGLFFGAFLGVGLGAIREGLADARQEEPQEYADVRAVAEEASRRLRTAFGGAQPRRPS